MNFNLFLAEHKLKMFKLKVKSVIVGLEECSILSQNEENLCGFDNWFAHLLKDNSRFGSVIEISEKHEEMHAIASNIEKLINQQKLKEARIEYLNFEKFHNEVIKMLKKQDYNSTES